MGKYSDRAKELHLKGYNCAQATAAACAELTDLEEEELLRVSSCFGGGLGKLREVCGALSGILMIVGALYGHGDVNDERKNNVEYPRVREFAEKFKNENGSILCRDLLQLEGSDPANNKGKTCQEIIGDAVKLLEEYIAEHSVENPSGVQS